MADAIQSEEDPDPNVILVDWEEGASTAYLNAAENVLTVGDEVANYIQSQGYDPKKITLIGHGLGAHVAGDAGFEYRSKTNQSIGKIIGLDPAGPWFEGEQANQRLSTDDAEDVVAIHTSDLFGYDEPLGDLNLYVNARPSKFLFIFDELDYAHPHLDSRSLEIKDHQYAYNLLTRLLTRENVLSPNTNIDPNTNKVLSFENLFQEQLYNDGTGRDKVWDFQEQPTVRLSSRSVRENSASGTVVGTLSIKQPAPDRTFLFELVDDASERFRVAETNQLVVNNGSLLDFETNTSHNIVVQAKYSLLGLSISLPYGEPTKLRVNILDEPEEDDPEDPSPFPSKPVPDEKWDIPILRPSDPNDIIGPEGFGDEHWVPIDDTLSYTIRFENQATATAPAQTVTITHPLDTDLDLRTFRLSSFGWGNLTFNVPENSAFYNKRLDLTATRGYFVDVSAGIDTIKGEAFWTVTTIDPNTGDVPADALTGFLPPNNNDGIGDGFVNYTIKAKRDVTTGTVIDAKATIIFDTEAPIDTPPIFNTLDAGKPTSTVNPLPILISTNEFLVNWTGEDDLNGSALANYTIYVSDNGGEYTPMARPNYTYRGNLCRSRRSLLRFL